jgi:hypothetical protein
MNDDFTPVQLNQREPQRFKRYKELLDFYHGRPWPARASRGEKQLTFNYAKTVTDLPPENDTSYNLVEGGTNGQERIHTGTDNQ